MREHGMSLMDITDIDPLMIANASVQILPHAVVPSIHELDSPLGSVQRCSPSCISMTNSARRFLLLNALDHANEAVRLDSSKQPLAAILEYRRCTMLLREAMKIGPSEAGRTAASSFRQIQALHDAYTKRIDRLIMKYNIPPLPLSM